MAKKPPAKLPIPFKVGEYVRIVDDVVAGHIGKSMKVLEASEEDGTVRTEFGWYMPTQVEPAAPPEFEIEIDGKTAKVVLNGKSGAIQEELVEQSLEQIVANIAAKQGEIDVARSEAGRIRKRCRDLENQREAMIREACAVAGHDVALPFEPEEDDFEGDEAD